ncbi:MAG: orotate phosphoribosyltransferase [Crocinitomicaceae bacterium]|nr:orotate phosphoribosyltransferase [Crocinitomicaceae bacterium]|tara:strand:+ start:7645 stop:8286 length:642 start_codon:yes stop_codon:yes gene_type:complete
MSELPISAKVAEFLLKINAVQLQPENPFTWASGWRSPIYCDNRKILGYPEARSFIRDAFVELITNSNTKPDVIAGVATGGIAIGALVAQEMNLPFCYVRSSAKSHGLNNTIEGNLKSNETVFVIEDLISSGMSSLKAVEDIRKHGNTVVSLGAIFTYGFDKASNSFRSANCEYHTLTNYNQLIEIAVSKNYISSNEIGNLKEWRKNPSIWKQQ